MPKNGVELKMVSHPRKPECYWQAIQLVNGTRSAVHHARRLHLEPVLMELTDDLESYWIDGAIIYRYNPANGTLFIKLKKLLNEQDKTMLETVKLCPQT